MLTAAMAMLVGAPQVGAPFEVILDRTAGLQIRDEGSLIARVGFGMFRTGWQWTGPEQTADAPGNPMTARASWSGGQATLVGTVTELADGIRFVLQATPNTSVGTESVHLHSEFPVGDWVGGSVNIDGTTVSLPTQSTGSFLFGGNATTARWTNGDLDLTIQGNAARSSLLQDSRQWGGGFEWRYGTQGGTWSSGATRTYTVELRSPRGLDFAVATPMTIEEGPDWRPLPAVLDVAQGSVLDWSVPASPAGSKGFLKVQGGKFVFEKDPSPQRFVGANLAFTSMFMDKADSDRLARRLAMMGYNAVRLHHYDETLTSNWSGQGSSSTVINEAQMDRLNYLIAALKKRGIYIAIDLFTIRQIRNDEAQPGATNTDEYKALQLVSPTARNNWREFASKVLNTYNPYTKLRWKDDPVLAWICPVNENNMGSATRSLTGTSRPLFDQAWQSAGNSGSWSYENDAGARFGATLHATTFNWMKSELRSMGVRALLTDLNGWHDQRILTQNRESLDFVDNHFYWDHPQFLQNAWSIPSRGWNNGGMATKAFGGGLQNLALTRVWGKPFMVSEYNFVAPNRFRAEGGLLIGALAARQDWDSLFRFAWSHNANNVLNLQRFDYFDLQSDPAALASERAIVSLFLRRDLPMAKDTGVWKVDPNASGAAQGYGAGMQSQIFTRRIGSSTTEGGDGNLPDPGVSAPVTIDQAKGILSVNSERTVGVFGPVGRDLVAGPLSTLLSGHRGALWVSSHDALPVTTSNRMLLVFVTDVQNSGIRFSGPDRDVLEHWGGLPHLVRNGTAQVSLAIERPQAAVVYRLNMAGERVSTVPSSVVNGKLTFSVSIDGASGATLYHEIVRDANGNRRNR